jgi:uncharacterized membrane protein
MTMAIEQYGERREGFGESPQGPAQLATTRAPRINVGQAERVASAVVGGAMLALGLRRPGLGSALLGLLGGGLLVRGVSGHCPVYSRLGSDTAHGGSTAGAQSLLGAAAEEQEQERTITIGRPAEELFRAWQSSEVQARIMAHFASISGDEGGRLGWRVRTPLGRMLSFSTEPSEKQEHERLVWRSTPDSELTSVWTLQLRKAPRDYGTELTLRLRVEPTGGLVPHMLSKLLGMPTRVVLERALRNFKALVESGEIPSTFHNSSARRGARSDAEAPHALRASL